MDWNERERLMDIACGILLRGARHVKLPVQDLMYDTDEAGQTEWIHMKYTDGMTAHVDISGLDINRAFDLVWEQMKRCSRG